MHLLWWHRYELGGVGCSRSTPIGNPILGRGCSTTFRVYTGHPSRFIKKAWDSWSSLVLQWEPLLLLFLYFRNLGRNVISRKALNSYNQATRLWTCVIEFQKLKILDIFMPLFIIVCCWLHFEPIAFFIIYFNRFTGYSMGIQSRSYLSLSL